MRECVRVYEHRTGYIGRSPRNELGIIFIPGADTIASKCANLVEIGVSGTSVSVCGASMLLRRFEDTLRVFVVDNLDVILRAISLRVADCDKSFGIVEFRQE